VIGIFYPDRMVGEIYDLSLSELASEGVKAILCDLDDTLTPYYDTTTHPRLEAWIEEVKAAGIKLCILSNGKKDRILPMCNQLGLVCLPMSCKPLPFGYIRALRKLGLKRKELVCIGDQIFTDVLGGNLMGIRTVLVEPIAYKTSSVEVKKRQIEKRFRREKGKNA